MNLLEFLLRKKKKCMIYIIILFHSFQPNFRRAGSQPPEYFSTAVQNQVKQGLEMVKLLRVSTE